MAKILNDFQAILSSIGKKYFSPYKMSQQFEKFHIIHLWLGQHDALCNQNYVWSDPHTVPQPDPRSRIIFPDFFFNWTLPLEIFPYDYLILLCIFCTCDFNIDLYSVLKAHC